MNFGVKLVYRGNGILWKNQRTEDGPRKILNGSVIKKFNNSKTPFTVMPINLKGSSKSHMKG